MKRCTIILPDAGPINSLWVADQLDLLLKVGSADNVITETLHTSKPGRRPGDAWKFTDLPDGVDEAAAIGSSWKP